MNAPYPYQPRRGGYPPAGFGHGNGYDYNPGWLGYWYGHGQFPAMRYQSLEAIPQVWEPFTVYYIKAPTERVARHFYTDATGIPYPANEAVFEEWRARPGNSTKTLAEFVDALTSIVVRDHTHIQASPSSTWMVLHNLGFKPVIQAYDTAGLVLGNPTIQHISNTQASITFVSPVAGEARCV